MKCACLLQRIRRFFLPAPRHLFWLFFACSAAAAPISSLAAQVPELVVASDTLQEIRLVDGSTLIGRVVQGGWATVSPWRPRPGRGWS
jgi:hypothetical protein